MARARTRILLTAFLAVWGIAFYLSLKSVLDRTATSSIYVEGAASAGGYPVFTAFRPWFAAADSDLQPGDRLLSLSGDDLRGTGPLDFFVRFTTRAYGRSEVTVVFERGGVTASTSLPVGSAAIMRPLLPVSFSFAAATVILLWRARSAPVGRAFAAACACGAVYFASSFGAKQPGVSAAGMILHVTSMTLAFPLFVWALLRFRQHDWRPHVWARLLPWIFLPIGAFEASGAYGAPFSPGVGLVGSFALASLGYVTLLVIGAWNYRRADPIERRQMKWGIFGLYCALVLPISAFVVTAFDPRLLPLALASVSTVALGPVFLVIALTQYDVVDVDHVISATASYNVVLILLIGAAFMVVPRVAAAAASLLGTTPAFGQLVLSLAVAAAIVPGQRRLRPLADRLFHPERQALERGTQALLADLARCSEPEDLLRRLGEGLDALTRPDTCVIYGRTAATFEPVFVRGRVVPPAYAGDGELAAALRWNVGALDVARLVGSTHAGSGDRAALESLGAVLLLPARRGETLEAFVCLGAKRSGDIYTATDRTLLGAIADAVSRELLRFAEEEILAHARQMQETLRRYVPGAVAARLESGDELAANEREVSVLFVDIRGYTSFSETRAAADVFSTVNRYTRLVSEIVRANGGSVVEFNGDGMMAVFGAPIAVAGKERAALRSGLAVCDAIVAEHATLASVPLSVGVGIATGPAFVGNIQAADRLIWTAIGNTINLAARLQSLTRDLQAAIVVDGATWRAGGDAATGFVLHENVPIRGRQQPEDVYVLPLPASGSAI